jgi:hypothetical protein
MTNSSEQEQWWYCLKHHRVEGSDTACAGKDLLGPYPSHAEAERALEKVRERNREWDSQD